jgi:ubiquinone/menaquinone biosynthesis C-methylase UbiE
MTTDYDLIAEQYREAKCQPWRRHVECFTLCELVGGLRGESVLDLACGEGFYSRVLRGRGAGRVVGVDRSGRMIELARAQEARVPLGIEYRVGDARALDPAERFDLVVAAYLLNYARTGEELLEMCRAAAGVLKPGGRFVGINNNPAQDPETFELSRRYGLVKTLSGALREGAPITFTIILDGGPLDITNYYLSPATHESAFRSAGFTETRWHPPRVSPEGVAVFGKEYWAGFLEHAPVAFFECVKGPE